MVHCVDTAQDHPYHEISKVHLRLTVGLDSWGFEVAQTTDEPGGLVESCRNDVIHQWDWSYTPTRLDRSR